MTFSLAPGQSWQSPRNITSVQCWCSSIPAGIPSPSSVRNIRLSPESTIRMQLLETRKPTFADAIEIPGGLEAYVKGIIWHFAKDPQASPHRMPLERKTGRQPGAATIVRRGRLRMAPECLLDILDALIGRQFLAYVKKSNEPSRIASRADRPISQSASVPKSGSSVLAFE